MKKVLLYMMIFLLLSFSVSAGLFERPITIINQEYNGSFNQTIYYNTTINNSYYYNTTINQTVNQSFYYNTTINQTVNQSFYYNTTINNSFYIAGGNSTFEIINAVNETALNGTNFFNILWSNIANKFITAVDNIYLYMSGTTITLNETRLNNTIIALEDYNTTLDMQKALLPNLTHLENSKVSNFTCGTGYALQNGTNDLSQCIALPTLTESPTVQSFHICEFGLFEDTTGTTHNYNIMFTHGVNGCPFRDGYTYTICSQDENYQPGSIGESRAKIYLNVITTDKLCDMGGGYIGGGVWHPKERSGESVFTGDFTYGVRMKLTNPLLWEGSLSNVTMFVNDGENISKRSSKIINLTNQWEWFYLDVSPINWGNSRRWGVQILYGQELAEPPFTFYQESFQIEWEQAVIIQ